MLYPLNALIEDQLSRVRRACDNGRARQWFTGPIKGNHFWFGRYNAVAPVSGMEESPSKRAELKKRLLEMDRDWGRALASAAVRGSDDILHYFRTQMDPRCGRAGTCRATHPTS